MKRIFDLYIQSSLHVALAVASFTGLTYLHFGLPFNLRMITLSFLGTVAGYNFIKFGHLVRRVLISPKVEQIIIAGITLISVLASLLLVTDLRLPSLSLLFLLGLIVLFYPHSFFASKRNLRRITGFKIVAISIVWSGFSVLLPAIEANVRLDTVLLSEFIQRCLFVILLTLPFDLRDLRADYGEVKTIPSLIGIHQTKRLSIVISAVIIIMALCMPSKEFPMLMAQLFVLILLVAAILRLPIYQANYFASFWIESIPILWFIVSLMLFSV
ncbi:hypothetical protein [Rhodohalobacter halophilus]|uniref:hypothetical protein n=1 Tax=Rhodohalobacter halophilus TaxID=1812810 RepID=UPI00083F6082|nr:hypothetical protein [Rhodohalobacter halophilus]